MAGLIVGTGYFLITPASFTCPTASPQANHSLLCGPRVIANRSTFRIRDRDRVGRHAIGQAGCSAVGGGGGHECAHLMRTASASGASASPAVDPPSGDVWVGDLQSGLARCTHGMCLFLQRLIHGNAGRCRAALAAPGHCIRRCFQALGRAVAGRWNGGCTTVVSTLDCAEGWSYRQVRSYGRPGSASAHSVWVSCRPATMQARRIQASWSASKEMIDPSANPAAMRLPGTQRT